MVSSANGLRSHARMPFWGSQICKHPRMGTSQGTPQTLALLIQHQRASHTRYSNSTITLNDNSHKSSLSLGRHPTRFCLRSHSSPAECFRRNGEKNWMYLCIKHRVIVPPFFSSRHLFTSHKTMENQARAYKWQASFRDVRYVTCRLGNVENNFSYINCLIRFSTQRKHFENLETAMRHFTYLGEAEFKVGNLETSNEAFQ